MHGDRTRLERAVACLSGAAIGDALGMPTQDLTSRVIAEDYGWVDGFRAAGPRQVIAAGAPAGMITDDTEQLLIVAELLIRDGRVEPAVFAQRLLEWEAEMIAKDSLDLLGPSTKQALQRLQEGVPLDQAGAGGVTNGAAMRIAPMGIAYLAHDADHFIREIRRMTALTHDSSIAVGSAVAVAGTVSAGIGGAGRAEAVALGLELARRAMEAMERCPGPDLLARIEWATAVLTDAPEGGRVRILEDLIGTTVAASESIPAAFAILAAEPDPWAGLLLATNAGGDTDTVAAIAGAMYGATGGTWPTPAVETVRAVNGIDIESTARGLLRVRATTSQHSNEG